MTTKYLPLSLLLKKTKPHKRRVKDVAQQQYSQTEADRGAGKTREVLPKVRANVPEADRMV
jgi:hypothetical protein